MFFNKFHERYCENFKEVNLYSEPATFTILSFLIAFCHIFFSVLKGL